MLTTQVRGKSRYNRILHSHLRSGREILAATMRGFGRTLALPSLCTAGWTMKWIQIIKTTTTLTHQTSEQRSVDLVTYLHNPTHTSHLPLFASICWWILLLPATSPPCSCSLGFSSGSPPLPGVVNGSDGCKLLWFDDPLKSKSPPVCEPLENFTESSSTCKDKEYKSKSK